LHDGLHDGLNDRLNDGLNSLLNDGLNNLLNDGLNNLYDWFNSDVFNRFEFPFASGQSEFIVILDGNLIFSLVNFSLEKKVLDLFNQVIVILIDGLFLFFHLRAISLLSDDYLFLGKDD